MPQATQVSVVVQGPVSRWTGEVIASVGAHLPGAQVILSTWKGSTLPPEADAVEVVLSDDPGSGPVAHGKKGWVYFPWNTNRMLTSTRAGLAVASREYVLKLRTDTPITGPAVLSWDAARRPGRECLFEERIISCSIATRPPTRQPEFLHHPSDCVHFGRREDLLDLWGGELVDEADNVGWWARRGEPSTISWDARYANEQILWLACLARSGVEVDYPYAGSTPAPDEIARAQRLLFDSFAVLEPWQLDVQLPKLQQMVDMSALNSYTWYEDWLPSFRSASASR